MSPWFSQLNTKSQRNSSWKCNSSYLATQQRINPFHHKNIKKTSEIYHKTWPAINLVSPFITTTWQGSSSPTKVPHTLYRIAENFHKLVKNKIFAEKTFTDFSLVPRQRTPCPQISLRKLSRIATKPRNSRKFSPLKVSLYMVFVLPLLRHCMAH